MCYNKSMRNNYSSQRELIFKVLSSTTCHPTAEWVWERCRESMPSISKATVYRNLAGLVKSGRAIEVAGKFGSSHFDARVQPHNHVVCRVCGAVEDSFPSKELALALEHGLESRGYDGYGLTFEGLCESCRQKRISAKAQ